MPSNAAIPLYDQDRFYYVVQGELTIQDPETGDVAVARTGEAVYWRGARHHFGYNFGTDEVFVLDWYAPQERAATGPEIETSLKKREPRAYQSGRADLLGCSPRSRCVVMAWSLPPCVGRKAWRGREVQAKRPSVPRRRVPAPHSMLTMRSGPSTWPRAKGRLPASPSKPRGY